MKDLLSKFYRGRGIFIFIIIILLVLIILLKFDCGSSGTTKTDKSDDNTGNQLQGKNSLIVKQYSSVIDTISTGSKTELLSIFKLNAARIIAVGKGGSIFTSSNGGLNWIQRSNANNKDLYTVTMLNSRTYIACGAGGVILRTNNFGSSWSNITSPDSTATIKSVSFADTSIGFAANGTNKILKTINGGLSWIAIPVPAGVTVNSVFAVNGGNVYTCGDSGKILTSTDAGVTWLTRTSGVLVNLNSISMAGPDFGKIAGNSGTILTTTNGGANWIKDSTFTTFNINSISVSNPNLSFACGDSVLQRKQGSKWMSFGPKSQLHSMSIPRNYCNAICDGDIYILGSESCPCTHNIQLSYEVINQQEVFWTLSVTPDLTQNIRDLVRVEVGGNVTDNTITGWTQYVDNVTGNQTSTEGLFPITRGNQFVQVTAPDVQTSSECYFMELPLSGIDGNDTRSIKFKITPINSESSTLVPIYINFLDSPRNCCLVRKYIVDCNPNSSSSTAP